MTQDVVDLLIDMMKSQNEKIDNLEKKIDGLIEFKNKLIGIGVLLSVIFAGIWDFFKGLFGRN
jgi:hypothetical protein